METTKNERVEENLLFPHELDFLNVTETETASLALEALAIKACPKNSRSLLELSREEVEEIVKSAQIDAQKRLIDTLDDEEACAPPPPPCSPEQQDEVLYVRDYVDPYASPSAVDASVVTLIIEELYKTRYELQAFRKEVMNCFKNMDYRKIKKNRTLQNRCTFVNRRGESCRGYICKVPGSRLCYAHHVISSAAQYPEKRKKLY